MPQETPAPPSSRFQPFSTGVAVLFAAFIVAWPLWKSGSWDLGFLRDPLPGDPAAALPQRLRVWGGFARTLFLSGVLVLTVLGWGSRLRRFLGRSYANRPLTLACEIALGSLFLSLLAQALAWTHLWGKTVFLVLAALLFLASFPSLATLFKNRKRTRAFPGRDLPHAIRWVAWGGVVLLGVSLAQALAPDVFYDSLVYHLSTLDAWTRAGGFAPLPSNLYSHYPFGGECFFAWGALLGGAPVAKVLNVLLLSALALGAAGWAHERSGPTAGALAFGLILTFPLSILNAWTLHNEAGLALFLLLAAHALSKSRDGNAVGWIAVAGLLTGAALGVKYLAFPWAVCVWAVWVFVGPRPREPRPIAMAFALALVPCLPWFLKNLVTTGAPLYPYGWPGGTPLLPAWASTALMADHGASWTRPGAWTPGWFWDRVMNGQFNAASALALLPFALLTPLRRDATRFLLLTALLALGAGFLATGMLRLLLPAFALAFTAEAAWIGSSRHVRLAGAVTLAAAILALPPLGRVGARHYQCAGLWLGRETPRGYLARMPQTAYVRAAEAWKPSLGPNDRVLLVGETRGAYLPFDARCSGPYDDPPLAKAARESSDLDTMGLALKKLGITHLWVAAEEGVRLHAQNPGAWEMPEEALARLSLYLTNQTTPIARYENDLLLQIKENTGQKRPWTLPWLPAPRPPQSRHARNEASREAGILP